MRLTLSAAHSASVNPIIYTQRARCEGAYPTFIDSERTSWNMDPALLVETLEKRARVRRKPAAVLLVHLYQRQQ